MRQCGKDMHSSTLQSLPARGTERVFCRRRCRRRRLEREARDVEAAATVPEPKEMYLVVHPGIEPRLAEPPQLSKSPI